MKKTMILLALTGICYSGAEAQTKKPEAKLCKCQSPAKKTKTADGKLVHKHTKTTTASGDTYQVCREMGGHYECCTHHKKVTTTVTQ